MEQDIYTCSVKKRLNSTFCDLCGIYGHEKSQKCHMRRPVKNNDERPKMRQGENKGRNVCNFCGKQGHIAVNCFSRQRSAFCEKCNTLGHEENQYCQNPNPREGRSQDRGQSAANRDRTAERSCYICGQTGHISFSCPKRQTNNQGNLDGAGQSQ